MIPVVLNSSPYVPLSVLRKKDCFLYKNSELFLEVREFRSQQMPIKQLLVFAAFP